MKSSETPNRPSLATDLDCVGCFACVSRCPVKAISVEQHNDGHDYICIDESKCIGCLKCERVCKDIHTKNGSNDLNLSELFGGWSTDDIQRSNGTSGGVFAAFAEYIIRNGGVVVGAHFDGRTCKHKVVRTVEEISDLQGSKYTPSSLLGLYEEIDEELKNGTVLFSGLGCQCAAVLAYFRDSKWKTYESKEVSFAICIRHLKFHQVFIFYGSFNQMNLSCKIHSISFKNFCTNSSSFQLIF